jgi:hypothetical protein
MHHSAFCCIPRIGRGQGGGRTDLEQLPIMFRIFTGKHPLITWVIKFFIKQNSSLEILIQKLSFLQVRELRYREE